MEVRTGLGVASADDLALSSSAEVFFSEIKLEVFVPSVNETAFFIFPLPCDFSLFDTASSSDDEANNRLQAFFFEVDEVCDAGACGSGVGGNGC